MNTLKSYVCTATFVLLLLAATSGAYSKEMDLLYEFQLDQLLDPSEEQLEMEKDGQVFIYDGLKESDIKLALDQQQHRMHSMMFISVVWTDDNGQPVVDPYTGEVVTDNDC